MVPTAAVLPTLEMLTIPVWIPDEVTTRSHLLGEIVHVTGSFCRDGNLLLIAHGLGVQLLKRDQPTPALKS